MRTMTLQEYTAALRRASYADDPTPELMLSVCPHVMPEAALQALYGAEGIGYIALPPVLVRGRIRIAGYVAASAYNRSAAFYGGRYAVQARPGQGVYRFADEALEYAEQHWGDQLADHIWPDTGQVRLVGGETDRQVSFWLDRPWRAVAAEAGRQLAVWDNAIAYARADYPAATELVGDAGHVLHHCAICGGGVGLDRCNGCGREFPEDIRRAGWDVPLPPKLVQLIQEQGHQFTHDPRLVQEHWRLQSSTA